MEDNSKGTKVEAITPWKYWGFETGDIGTGWYTISEFCSSHTTYAKSWPPSGPGGP